MEHFSSRVVSSRQVAEGTWTMEFEWKSEALPRPGTFFTLRCTTGTDPLLRRPFAFSGFDRGRSLASFIFLKRGKTTSQLSALAPGAGLDILGPLGNGFGLEACAARERAVLLSGGIGLGPILFLDAALRERGKAPLFLYGARTAGLVPAPVLPSGALVRTDDGSSGERGTVLDAMEGRWLPGDAAYACGPGPMLSALAASCAQAGRKCVVSVEQHMACGVGACMGCAVKAASGGYLRACADGPVFDAEVLSWE